MTEDEMVGWHHQLSGPEFEQALGVGEGQGSLACCSPGVAKSRTQPNESTTTTKGQGSRTSPCVHEAYVSVRRTNSKQVKHLFTFKLEVNSVKKPKAG